MSQGFEDIALSDVDEQHTPEAIRARLDSDNSQDDLRDLIYGAVDGTVTTFAIAAGAVGAGLSSGIVLVLGLANVLADGLSMAGANYLGTRAEMQRHHQIRREEEAELDLAPEGEREEVRQIMARMGFTGDDLDRAVEVITSDRRRWVDLMLREEHDLSLTPRSPGRAAIATFIAFLFAGFVPLVPFLFSLAVGGTPRAFAVSILLTVLAFVVIGIAKAHAVGISRRRSALETFAVGGAAASIAFIVGIALRRVAEA